MTSGRTPGRDVYLPALFHIQELCKVDNDGYWHASINEAWQLENDICLIVCSTLIIQISPSNLNDL